MDYNNPKDVFYIYCLSSLHCFLPKQNTSDIVFIIYQVTVVAMNIDIFKHIPVDTVYTLLTDSLLALLNVYSRPFFLSKFQGGYAHVPP